MSEHAAPPDDEQKALALPAQLVKVRSPVHRSTHSPPPANGETLTAEPVELPPADDSAPAADSAPGETATDDTAPPASASSLKTPNIVGVTPPSEPLELYVRNPNRYEILGEHGRGGLGRVMRARDKDLDRSVAIKELLRPSRTAEARFVREATITAKLQHPGIVPVHEAGRWPDGTPFYAMKLVAGKPLKQLIEESATLDERLALLEHVIAVADAVAYAHANGVIHRDLKPSNVVVGEFGETVVIDWGLAKFVEEHEPRNRTGVPYRGADDHGQLTVVGGIVGTPGYMAPEQAAGQRVDQRADVYSIGAVLWHVITGRRPSVSAQPVGPALDRTQMRSSSRCRPIRELEPALARDLASIVDRAISSHPDSRYPSALELAADLRKFREGKRVTAHVYSCGEVIGRWVRHHRPLVKLAASFACVLVVLAAVGVARLVREGDRTREERWRAESALGVVEAERDRLVLLQAEGALPTDPTRTLAWLKSYDGAEGGAAQTLAALAVASGVAQVILESSDGAIHRAIPHPDGRRIIAASTSGALREWSIAGGGGAPVELAELRKGLAFDVARDGTLAFQSRDGRTVVKSTDSGLRELRSASDSAVRDIRFAASSSIVVSSDTEGVLRAYDLVSNREWKNDLGSEVPRVAVADDGSCVFGCATDGTLFAWYPRSGTTIRSRCEGDSVAAADGLAVAIAADGIVVFQEGAWVRHRLPFDVAAVAADSPHRVVLTAGKNGTLALLRLTPTPEVVWRATTQPDPSAIGFRASDGVAFVGSMKGRIALHDLETGEVKRILRGHKGRVESLEVLSDGRLVSAGVDGGVRVWRIEPGPYVVAAVDDSVFHARYSPDGSVIAMDGRLGVVRLAGRGGRAHDIGNHRTAAFGIEWSPDGQRFATASWDGTAAVWSRDSEFLAAFSGHKGPVRSVRFVDPSTVVSGGADGKVLSWRTSGEFVAELTTHSGPVRRIAVSATGDVASLGEDGSLAVWRKGTTKSEVLLANPSGLLAELGFSPDGRQLTVVSDDGLVRVWTRPFAAGHSVVQRRRSAAVSLACSPLGACAVGWGDGLVTQIRQGGEVEVVAHGHGPVLSLAFDPTGEYLAAAPRGSPVHVFHQPSGRMAVFFGHEDDVSGLDFSRDGRLVSASYDGRVLETDLAELPWVVRSPSLADWLERTTNATAATHEPRSYRE